MYGNSHKNAMLGIVFALVIFVILSLLSIAVDKISAASGRSEKVESREGRLP